MTDLAAVLADLDADADQLDEILTGVAIDRWSQPTRVPEWTVALHVAHLAATFRMVALATDDPAAFAALTSRLSPDFDANVRSARSGYLLEPPGGLFPRWRGERERAVAALRARQDAVAWLGVELAPSVLAGGLLVELFGHAQDIADALGAPLPRTDRVRPVAEYCAQHVGALRCLLRSPSGAEWEFGEPGSAETIRGTAVDFCLAVTGRRCTADLDLTAEGDKAAQWLRDSVGDSAGTAGGLLPSLLATAR